MLDVLIVPDNAVTISLKKMGTIKFKASVVKTKNNENMTRNFFLKLFFGQKNGKNGILSVNSSNRVLIDYYHMIEEDNIK